MERWPPGTKLADFTIVANLGSGAMGDGDRARSAAGTPGAIKTF